jgi:hypothetical protein
MSTQSNHDGAWAARDEKGDRERRRLYLYSRSAISRSAAHDKREGDTSVTVVTSNNKHTHIHGQ